MSLSTISHVNIHQTMYLCLLQLSVTNSMLYLRVARHKILAIEIHVGSIIYEWFCRNKINMLYIILFTEEYRHVITLVFLLSHFTLKFCLEIPTQHAGYHLVQNYLRDPTNEFSQTTAIHVIWWCHPTLPRRPFVLPTSARHPFFSPPVAFNPAAAHHPFNSPPLTPCLRGSKSTTARPTFKSTATLSTPHRLAAPPLPPHLWQPTQKNTVLSPKTNPLGSLSNSKVSSCRWLSG
jgi:hypothetical protein